MHPFQPFRSPSPRILLGTVLGLSAALSPLAFAQTTTTIPAIQGKADVSTMVDQVVTFKGVVTGDFQKRDQLSGFTVQDPKGDGDPATSDGIFVFVTAKSPAANVDVKVGDSVSVTGTVVEFDDQTEITQVTEVKVLGAGKAPNPTSITLPLPPAPPSKIMKACSLPSRSNSPSPTITSRINMA